MVIGFLRGLRREEVRPKGQGSLGLLLLTLDPAPPGPDLLGSPQRTPFLGKSRDRGFGDFGFSFGPISLRCRKL